MTAALERPGVSVRADQLIALRELALHPDDAGHLSSLPGGMVSKKRGQGQEMADVREYVPGDDIRHLDRSSTARTGNLHVRSFQQERDRVIILVPDFRPAMLWGSRRAFRSVAAAEALALIGWRVIKDGGRVGLLTLGTQAPVVIAPRGRTRGMLAVIGGMVQSHAAALQQAMNGMRGDLPLDAGLSQVSRVAPTGAEVVIASGFDTLGRGFEERLGRLEQHRSLQLIRIRDNVAKNLPPGTYPMRLPDGSRCRVRVSGSNGAVSDDGEIAGFPTLNLDAGSEMGHVVRQITAASLAGQKG